MKKVLFLVLVFVFTSSVLAQSPNVVKPFDLNDYGVKIEPDKRLILMTVSLELAGIETPLNDKGKEFRQKIQEDFRGINPDLLEKMKRFLKIYKERHANASPSELAAPFISLAYAMTPLPDFNVPARTTDLPADLLEVLDFSVLVRDFYQNSGIQAKLPGYVQLYQAEGDKMNSSTREMINTITDYLHTTPQLIIYERVKTPDPKNKKQQILTMVDHERHFYIVPDLLASAGTVNFRNIGYDYYAIVPTNTNLRFSEAKRAYLQFVIDPVVLKYAKDVNALSDNIRKLVEARRKAGSEVSPDAILTVSRSLVAAVDARQREYIRVQNATDEARRKIDFAKTVEDKKAISADLNNQKQIFADETAVDLSEAYERGAVLAFYFAQQLKGLEDSGFDISSSLRDMILSIDVSKESNRLAEFADARQRGLQARRKRVEAAPQEELRNKAAVERTNALRDKLDEIEVVTKNKDYDESEARLKKLLEEYPGESSIYYALGRVASLSAVGTFDEGLRDKRLENAKLHYTNAIRSATADTNPALIQLCYVALGRIFEFYQDYNYAIQIYQTALSYGAANQQAYNEARAAIDKLSAPKKPQ